ncbi:MFS transporter [Actinocorallia longicatena]|uniref:MFS transporter n=1 Tax=Actinocorallia longicatena TaxID=111803 RepID=A0ABP6QGW0_9ACTN
MTVATSTWRIDFRLLWTGSAVSQFGSISTSTALPLLALAITHSAAFAGWVAAASIVPTLLVNLPAGLLVDRMDRRRIMFISQGVRVLTAVVLGCALWFVDDPWPGLLVIGAILDGTCIAFYSMAETVAMRSIVPDTELNGALARQESRAHVALLLGRPLGGLLFGLGRAMPYAADAVAGAVALVTLSMVQTKGFASEERKQIAGMRDSVSAGLRCIRDDMFLRRVLRVCTITNFMFQAGYLLLIVVASKSGMSGRQLGLLLGISGLGGALGSVAAPRLTGRMQPTWIIACSVWVWMVLVALMAAAHQPVVGLVAWGGISFMGANLNVALAVYQSRRVPAESLGTVMGIIQFTTRGAGPLGALCGGYVLTFINDTRAAAICASLVILGLAASITPREMIKSIFVGLRAKDVPASRSASGPPKSPPGQGLPRTRADEAARPDRPLELVLEGDRLTPRATAPDRVERPRRASSAPCPPEQAEDAPPVERDRISVGISNG